METDDDDHEFEKVLFMGNETIEFACHETSRACEVNAGGDFDYCPYCGTGL
jgi:hypothetical protein